MGVLFYSNNARVYFLGSLARWKCRQKQGMGSLISYFFSTHDFYFKEGRRRKKSTLLPSPQINLTVFLWWILKVEGKKLYRMGLLQC